MPITFLYLQKSCLSIVEGRIFISICSSIQCLIPMPSNQCVRTWTHLSILTRHSYIARISSFIATFHPSNRPRPLGLLLASILPSSSPRSPMYTPTLDPMPNQNRNQPVINSYTPLSAPSPSQPASPDQDPTCRSPPSLRVAVPARRCLARTSLLSRLSSIG